MQQAATVADPNALPERIGDELLKSLQSVADKVEAHDGVTTEEGEEASDAGERRT